ncbi:MAG: M6 family metalloprotease domain-containing protein [candidate division WOR-3 bacterium]
MNKGFFIKFFFTGLILAMPPHYPDKTGHSCIVGSPRERPKDLSRGSIETCVILVQFTDNLADTIAHNPACYDSMFYSTGVYYGQYRQGSLNDFFKENSYNQTDVRGGIVGNNWYMSSHPYSYYDDGYYMLTTGYQLAQDAVALVDATVNFQQYDLNNDNHLDGVFVIHAGPGAEDTGNPHQCWSHAIPSFNYSTNDGVIIDGATNVPEVSLVTPSLDTTLCCIGVMCHELGHVVGLPDLYDYSRWTWGVGYWSLMGYGAWGAGGNTPWSPSHADAWCKDQVGWLNLIPITSNTYGLRILDIETNPVAYRVWRAGGINDTFFILENRQNKGFDTPLPGKGLLIWHIDPRYGNYDDIVDLEEADGCDDLENGWGYRPDPHYYHHELGDSGDPYPGDSNNTTFGPNTYPSSNSNYGVPTDVTVRNISIVADTVICDVIIDPSAVSELKNAINNGEVSIKTNPVSGLLNIYYNFVQLKDVRFKVFNINGEIIEEIYHGILKDKGNIIWNPADLSAGVYFLKIEMAGEDKVVKFVYLR